MERMSVEAATILREQQLMKCRRVQPGAEAVDMPDDGKESLLLSKIVAHCNSWGWRCLPLWTSKKAKGFLLPGWPDLTICMPKGRTVFIELKSKDGRLRKEQADLQIQMMALGQEYYVIRSFKRFLEIVEGNERII